MDSAQGAYERELRKLLRYYPPNYRQRHGEEIIATAAELREPGASAPSREARWDLVKAGLATRWRERPPPHRWLTYRLFEKRLPFRYRMWAREDIMGRWYLGRRLLGQSLGYLVITVAPTVLVGLVMMGDPWLVLADSVRLMNYPGVATIDLPIAAIHVVALGCVFVLEPFLIRRSRRKMLRKHEFHPDGTPYAWGWGGSGDGRVRQVPT